MCCLIANPTMSAHFSNRLERFPDGACLLLASSGPLPCWRERVQLVVNVRGHFAGLVCLWVPQARSKGLGNAALSPLSGAPREDFSGTFTVSTPNSH